MWNNSSRLNKILIIAIIIAIPLAIFITVLQGQNQQTIKQRASEENSIILEAYPNTGSYAVGQSIDANITLTNKFKDISGVDLVINYDQDVLRLDGFDISDSGFTTIVNSSVSGKIHYVVINSTTAPLNSISKFDIGTLHFTSLKSTEGQTTNLNFVDSIISAAGYNDGIPFNQRAGQYTIEISTTPTLQPTSIPTPIISSKCPSEASLCGDICYNDPCDNGNPFVCENGIANCEVTYPTEAPPMWPLF